MVAAVPRGAAPAECKRKRRPSMARKRVLLLLMAALVIAGASVAVAQASTGGRTHHRDGDWGGGGQGGGPATATPIKHLVVIFQENVSFDHYFGTYPHAANTDGSPFYASPSTPTVNGLSGALLTNNPNLGNPQRLNSLAGRHVRPGPRLHRRAERLRPWPDGHVRAEDGGVFDTRPVPGGGREPGPGRRGRPQLCGDGLLRRQHRHRAVELRPALRDERQLLLDHVWALDARRDQRHRHEHVRRGLRPD